MNDKKMNIEKKLIAIVEAVGQKLKENKRMLATAESCTGGWVGMVITSVPGTSHWYDRGFVTYSNTSKREMLGVPAEVIARFGAVSEQTARAMADGALKNSNAWITLSVTGIAGPEGGSEDKPVGLVCFAWAGRKQETVSESRIFEGDRQEVRAQAVQHALEGVIKFVTA